MHTARTRIASFGVAAAALVVLAVPVSAAPGDLDPRFGGDGIVTAFADGAIGTSALVSVDGRAVVIGYTTERDADVVATRFRPDGTPDPTFGGDGRIRMDLGGSDVALDGAMTPDGGLVIVGKVVGGPNERIFVFRVDSGGRRVGSFGNDGVVLFGFDKPIQAATAVALTEAGRIVIGGYTSNGTTTRVAFARLLPNGALDPAFHGDGRFAVNLVPGAEQIDDVLLQPDGAIVAAGVVQKGVADRFAVVRVLRAGGMDTTFGTRGLATIDFGPGGDRALAVTAQPRGRVAVAGVADQGGAGAWAIARLGQAGRMDPNFGDRGRVVLPFGPAVDTAHDVMQAGRRLVAVGRIRAGGSDDMGIVRLRRNGSRDPTFGADGVVRVDVAGRADWAAAVARMPDGRIVVGGTATRDRTLRLAALRLKSA